MEQRDAKREKEAKAILEAESLAAGGDNDTNNKNEDEEKKQEGGNDASEVYKPVGAALGHGTKEDDDLNESFGQNKSKKQSRECPYLDTVNRHALDFDFEKRCSISLSNHNVYCCLVCGLYFQGRGPGTHAHTHSLQQVHHVFMHLRTGRVYCLPDGYEVLDPTLDDIKAALHPRFTAAQIKSLDRASRWTRGLDGTAFLPGTIGLNNLKHTDSINAVLQCVLKVPPLRNFFLVKSNYAEHKSQLVQRFGELVRKVWNPRNFKGQVSPHEFMQAVATSSAKRFTPEEQADPIEFLPWLLHTLHSDLTHRKPRKRRSVISDCFQGKLNVVTLLDRNTKEMQSHAANSDAEGEQNTEVESQPEELPFWMLGLDLPPAPLFQDTVEKNIIPQVPLLDILKKFDGQRMHEQVRSGRKKYTVSQLPPYLILHFKRFVRNNFFVEKNPTIVTFPVSNLDLKDCIPVPKQADGRPVRSKYDLIANVCHDGKPGAGSYRAHVYDKGDRNWFETQDLNVREVLPQQVSLSEALIMIYERQPGEQKREGDGSVLQAEPERKAVKFGNDGPSS